MSENYYKHQSQCKRVELKQAWVNLLTDQKNKYLLTIVFPILTNRFQTRKLLNVLLKHLNRRIYKNRYTRGEEFIKGFAISEFEFGETEHFHILIQDHSGYLPAYERFKELINAQVCYLNGSWKKNFIRKYQLDNYYNGEGLNKLEKYLTKDFKKMEKSPLVVSDSIGLLSEGDVCFG